MSLHQSRKAALVRKFVPRRRAVIAGLALIVPLTLPAAAQAHALPAGASPAASPHIIAPFSLADRQTPEALTVEPSGAADITFSYANQVVRVWPTGQVQTLAQMPVTGDCPVAMVPFTTGIVRLADGTLDVLACDGDSTTGVWSIPPNGGTPTQIAQLPADSLPNGLALDPKTDELYIADSLGGVWRVPATGGTPVVWASGPALQPVTELGPNGIEVANGSVWVSNTDQATILRIPIEPGGAAGNITTAVTGVGGADDFAVLPHNRIVLALDAPNEVVTVSPGGTPTTILTAGDGIDNPSDVKFWPSDNLPLVMYVTSAAYFTGNDPNLLAASFIP
jgi:hypothetical protein